MLASMAEAESLSERRSRGTQTRRVRTTPVGIAWLPTLTGDGGDGRFGGCRIEVATTGGRRLEVLVQLVDQWDAGRDVEPDDLLLTHPVEVLDQRPQRIAVRGHHDRLAGQQV